MRAVPETLLAYVLSDHMGASLTEELPGVDQSASTLQMGTAYNRPRSTSLTRSQSARLGRAVLTSGYVVLNFIVFVTGGWGKRGSFVVTVGLK
jgi:hypothetical protein